MQSLICEFTVLYKLIAKKYNIIYWQNLNYQDARPVQKMVWCITCIYVRLIQNDECWSLIYSVCDVVFFCNDGTLLCLHLSIITQ